VAILSVNSPVVSFQLESEEAHPKLLQLVGEVLESCDHDKTDSKEKIEGSTDKERDLQFKVSQSTRLL
jgi:hypothetical protein